MRLAKHMAGEEHSPRSMTSHRQPVAFQGLAAGPTNLTDANGNSLANVLFGIADTGFIYAFDTAGNAMNVFPGGTSRTFSTASPVGANFGLAFSPLDVNLWHITRTRAGEAGHGYPTTFDRSRSVPELAPLDRQPCTLALRMPAIPTPNKTVLGAAWLQCSTTR